MGAMNNQKLTWYHSRETPPASMPSSPWKCTDNLARISSGALLPYSVIKHSIRKARDMKLQCRKLEILLSAHAW